VTKPPGATVKVPGVTVDVSLPVDVRSEVALTVAVCVAMVV
jgi:hypothetical protein